jgi:3-hydroxyacyl-CoA dehydrogenase/enoyl-CoA hydratase/3-hydroxybutyryl-CoA epimerase/3-hydroxyacyl-CoA dehydrogenase/enoyl-CoA hydratase/3-hydroxybutyryl-CoA epimerase/enoyl-CoA isomerase
MTRGYSDLQEKRWLKDPSMSQTSTIALSFPEADVAFLTLDMPGKGANILASSVLDELEQQLDELEKRDDLAGLVIISGKPGMFIAGADLREFAASLDIERDQTVKMCRRGQQLFGRLSKASFVTVAAIDGICVGGGAELAIWCDRRVMSNGSKTEFGFPEVKIGLYPGWGGTVRTPRIVGLSNAVEMITSGNSVSPREAYAMGLASNVVSPEQLPAESIALIRQEQASQQFVSDRKQWSLPLDINETEMGFLGITAQAVIRQQTKGQYPAPMAALEVMMEAAGCDAETACQMEADGMSHLFGSSVNASLINIFFLNDRIKKDTGIENDSVVPRTIDSVGVIGSGIMGAGIAAANVKRKVPVVIMDAAQDALAKGVQNVMQEVSFNRETRSNDVDRAVELAPFLNIGSTDAEIANCGVIIEAIVENPEVKKKLFARLEPQMREDAILASNTSTIPITELAKGLKRPEQFCGIHFFNPVRKMKLVEVIRGELTTDETVATAVAHAKRIGKLPIVVNDGPGFLVNRLLLPYMNEAVTLLSEGASIKEIERAAKAFGMPMGPITLYDMVGLDTAVYAGKTMVEAFPDRVPVSPVVPALVKAGRLGQKSGAGFFSYNNRKRRAEPDPSVDEVLAPYINGNREFTQEEITSRLFITILLEATRTLEEKIVRDARDADFGLIFGIGFPPFKGGLLFWADTIGAANLVEQLKPIESIGERYKPTPLLLELAKDNRKFYDV